MKNCWDFIKCYRMLLLGVISLAIGTGLYMYQYISSSMDIKNDCIFKWSLSLNLIGIIAIAIFIICRYCCEKSDNPTSVMKSYIDNLNLLKRKYKCTRTGQYVIVVILLLVILLSVLIPRIIVLYKTDLIYSSEFGSLLFNKVNTLNIMNHEQISLFCNSISIFIIFIILCILFLYTIRRIRITSHKIKLIDSALTKIKVYDINKSCDCINIPVIGIKKNDTASNDYCITVYDRFVMRKQEAPKTQGTTEKKQEIPEKITITADDNAKIKFEIIYLINENKWELKCDNNQISEKMSTDISDETKKKLELEINRLTQELNADSSRNIWSAIFNSR